MIEFSMSPELEQLKEQTETFIRDVVIPYEGDAREGEHGPSDDLKRELMGKARDAGLLSPHVGEEWGGLGLNTREMAVVFEAAGYSTLGGLALNIQAPDEGNAHLLEQVATEEQKEKWLRPLAEGRIRTCFSMTEPGGGAGSDPSLMQTTAQEDGDHYVINGRKWLITGATGAALNIVMAQTLDADGKEVGATMFLCDGETPGFEILRLLDSCQLTAKHKVATPVNWKQGEDVIIVPAVSDDDAKEKFPEGWKAPKPYLRIVPQPRD